MEHVAQGGGAVDMEIWMMPTGHFGSFVEGIPAPMSVGEVKLADGSWVSGFVFEAIGASGATGITRLGSWHAWLAQSA